MVPSFQATTTVRKKFRWRGISGTSGNSWVVTIEDNHLLRALCVGITATSAAPIISAYRIRSITVYAIPSGQLTSGGSVTTLDFEFRCSWSTAASNADDYVKPTCDYPATAGESLINKIVMRPPRGSLASFWRSDATGEDIFTIKGTTPASKSMSWILDVDMDVTLNDIDNQEGTFAVTSATVGQVLSPRVDGTNSAAMAPMGYASFTI